MADVGSPLGAPQQAEDPWGSLPPPAPESFTQTHFGSTNAASCSGQAGFSPFASTAASWSAPQAVAGWGAPAYGAAGGWAAQAALQQQQLAAAALQQQAWAAHAAQAQALAHQQALLQQQQASDPAVSLLADLGVEESEEASFRWIAEYALRDDALPPPWQKHQDTASGRVFYSEGGGESSSWAHPMLPHLQRIVETGRLFKEDPRETLFEEARAALWHEQKEELDVWSGPYQNHSGRTYFLNGHSGVTSFHDPRERAQFTYQVQTSLLDHLREVLAEEAAASPAASDSPRFGLPRFGEQPEEPAELPTSPTSTAMLSPTSSAPDGKRRGAWRRKKEETTSEEKKLAIADMRSKAVQLFTVCLEEDEVQRLQLARKSREVEQRRDRLAATAAALPPLPVLPSLFPQSPAAASNAGVAPRKGDTGSVTPRTSLTPRMAIPSPCTPRMSQEAAAREVAAVAPTTPRDVELPAEPGDFLPPPPPPLPLSP